MTVEQEHGHSPHDWLSPDYVQGWVNNDLTKDAERRPILRRLLALAPHDRDKHVKVLDLGGGYGFVTSIVLEAFPHARVTLQDYSAPMLDNARQRLAEHADAVRFSLSDLRDPGWVGCVEGPFDLVVSSIALHTIGGREHMEQVYHSVYGLLEPGGRFLNCDYDYTAPAEMHAEWLTEGGFEQVETAAAGREHLFFLSGRKPG